MAEYKHVMISLKPEQHERLKELAKKADKTVSEYVRIKTGVEK